MATNVQINTGEDTAVLYFQDGSSMVVQPNSNESIQLVDNGICTISEAETVGVSEEEGEHPPPKMPFIERMIKFWQTLAAQIKGQDPTATPMDASVESKSSPQRRDYKKKEGDDGYGDEPPPQ